MQVVVLVGASGAGKSTYARAYVDQDYIVCSADHAFVVDGIYKFAANRLSEAHGMCFRQAIESLLAGRSVVVDNTNTTTEEIAPYILLAQSMGAECVVIHVPGPVDLARNVHGVPVSTVQAQLTRIARTLGRWPKWWPTVHVAE